MSRYQVAVEAIKGGSEMWIKLGSSNLHDAKAKKVGHPSSALVQNS